MNVSVEADDLRAMLDAPHSVPAACLTLIAANDQLTVVADDGHVRVVVQRPATVNTSGYVIVPSVLIHNLAEVMPPGIVQIDATDALVELHGGDDPDDNDETNPLRASIWSVPVDSAGIPEMPALPERVGQVDMAEFVRSMRQVTPAATDRSRLPVVSVRAIRGHLLCAATDTYRLHVTRSRMVEASSWMNEALIPLNAIRLATTMFPTGEVDLHLDHNVIVLRSETAMLAARLVDAKFPSYQKVLPRPEDSAARVLIDTAALLAALARIDPIASTKNAQFAVTVASYPEANVLTVEASADDIGQSKATVRPTSVTGAGFSFTVDLRHLVAAAKASACQRLYLYWYGDRRSVLIAGFGSEFQAVVMTVHRRADQPPPTPTKDTAE